MSAVFDCLPVVSSRFSCGVFWSASGVVARRSVLFVDGWIRSSDTSRRVSFGGVGCRLVDVAFVRLRQTVSLVLHMGGCGFSLACFSPCS